jgi:hypothetical protein
MMQEAYDNWNDDFQLQLNATMTGNEDLLRAERETCVHRQPDSILYLVSLAALLEHVSRYVPSLVHSNDIIDHVFV